MTAAGPASAEALFDTNDDIVAIGLADGHADGRGDGKLVCAVAERHERATERYAVDGASDLDATAGAEQGGGVGHLTQVQVSPSRTRPNVPVNVMSSGPIVDFGMFTSSLVQSSRVAKPPRRCHCRDGARSTNSSDLVSAPSPHASTGPASPDH